MKKKKHFVNRLRFTLYRQLSLCLHSEWVEEVISLWMTLRTKKRKDSRWWGKKTIIPMGANMTGNGIGQTANYYNRNCWTYKRKTPHIHSTWGFRRTITYFIFGLRQNFVHLDVHFCLDGPAGVVSEPMSYNAKLCSSWNCRKGKN